LFQYQVVELDSVYKQFAFSGGRMVGPHPLNLQATGKSSTNVDVLAPGMHYVLADIMPVASYYSRHVSAVPHTRGREGYI